MPVSLKDKQTCLINRYLRVPLYNYIFSRVCREIAMCNQNNLIKILLGWHGMFMNFFSVFIFSYMNSNELDL